MDAYHDKVLKLNASTFLCSAIVLLLHKRFYLHTAFSRRRNFRDLGEKSALLCTGLIMPMAIVR